MKKQSKKRMNRIRSLIIICALTAILISVSTYAWFIGMRTVNVSSFDVEIAATDSLLLSLNGTTWDSTVTISKGTMSSASYNGNTNSWGNEGLFPLSSVGEMDEASSRMKLFEKASLTTTPGGYRLMASRVHNYEEGNDEQEGYVVFDLFIKNFSGTQYNTNLDELDEEAIYLTTDSEVKVADVGGVANTGIENSVRVAFTQVGRVAGTTTAANTITGITCATAGDVTGICRDAQIWEPNDTLHVASAISWYDTSCLLRTAPDLTKVASYTAGSHCGAVVNGVAYPTYAVKEDVTSADRVDVYDGPAYNGYAINSKIEAFPYFTDTMKDYEGTSRPTFMTLAPNSITKLRIYVYIEGQDIDNYDFASIGKKISVKFGFTKERFVEGDIDYTENGGPSLDKAKDIIKPVITLTGDSEVTIAKGAEYTDAGATASDNLDGNITSQIVKTGTVDVNNAGTYYIRYNVEDSGGNKAVEVTRTVRVTE